MVIATPGELLAELASVAGALAALLSPELLTFGSIDVAPAAVSPVADCEGALALVPDWPPKNHTAARTATPPPPTTSSQVGK
jgi:hypothetical protein